MKKRTFAGILCVILLASLSLTLPAAAADSASGAENTPARTSAVMLIPQGSGIHTKYMSGSGGWFFPERPVTRAELAQMLSSITADTPEAAPSFYDVPADAWYAPAALKVVGLGLMASSDGAFRPDAPATRAECAAALSMMIPYDAAAALTFPDVGTDHWAWQAISRTATYGLFRGDSDGEFHPDDSIKRCEAVTVFNRLLGRTPDMAYMTHQGILESFPDVPVSHWAYGDIMEAVVTHECTTWVGTEVWIGTENDPVPSVPSLPDLIAVQPYVPQQPVIPEQPAPAQTAGSVLPEGPQRIDGRLHWVVNGEFVRGQSVSGLYFDENGCYTTGNAELDVKLNAIVDELTNDSMTRDQKLRVLFDYVVNNFKYLARPMVSKDATGWEPEYALFFLNNGKGNCFSFAAAYCLLCRELGLSAYTVVGASGKPTSPHGWVEIVLDSSVYMFDPELQWYYNNKTTQKYDLFQMPPTEVPSGVYRYIW